MLGLAGSNKIGTVAHWLLLVAVLSLYLLGSPGAIQTRGQTGASQTHVVSVASEPPGAVIWKKVGRDYLCTDAVTPAKIELEFHDSNDVKQLLLRRFGYSSHKLLVGAADQKAHGSLTAWSTPFFAPSADAPSDVRRLDGIVKEKFEQILVAENGVFRCAPFEFRQIAVYRDDASGRLGLYVAIDLSPSASRNFRLGRHADQERQRGIARAALDSSVAEVLARFRAVLASVPEIQDVLVACFYSTTEPVLGTERHSLMGIEQQWVVRFSGGVVLEPTPVWRRIENTVVTDQETIVAIIFRMPVAKIPLTGDKKAITEAVLAIAEIKVAK
jgi:hypothetical protein